MVVPPQEQQSSFTSARKREHVKARKRPYKPRSQAAPPTAQQPKRIYGQPPQALPQSSKQRRMLNWAGLRARGIYWHVNYVRKLWERGDFPRPFKPTPGGGRLAWWEHEVDAWLEAKAAEQEGGRKLKRRAR